MARYVSKYRNFTCAIDGGRVMVLADGQHQELSPMIDCKFTPWDFTEHEYQEAVAHFQFRGMPSREPVLIDGQFGEPVTDPRFRISAFDTEAQGWDRETIRRVEENLEKSAWYGLDYIRVEPEALPKPWPRYDQILVRGRRTIEQVVQTITDTVRELGLDPADVSYYERMTLNRPEVLAGLDRITLTDPTVEETIEIGA